MNNLIKKIIRESLDSDWSWTQFDPVQPRKKGEIKVGDVYTIYGSDKSIRYVLEIVDISSNPFEDEDDEGDNGGGTVRYEIIVSPDLDDEPVGSIQITSGDRAKRLVKDDEYWILTDSLDKGFIGESYDDLNWIKETIPVGEMVIDALKSNKRYDVITEYDNNGNLIELEIYDTYDSGRFFGVDYENITYENITYSDVLKKSKESLDFCFENNNSEEITEQYQQLYNLLNEYQYKPS